MKKHILLGMVLGICFSLTILNPSFSAYSNNSEVIKHSFNNQLTIQLPQSTKTLETEITEKGQLLYSVYLDDQVFLMRGYIQLWNLDDLENYLFNSKRISTFDFHSYSIKPIEAANLTGYLTEWTASFGDSYRISGMEYWLKKSDGSEVLRVSFFTDSTSFSQEQTAYINKTINSINWQ